MQLDEDKFLRMTWGKFMIAAQGFHIRRERLLEGHRMTALLIYNTNTKKQYQKTARQFWELPYIDGKKKQLKWDKEKALELIEKWTK